MRVSIGTRFGPYEMAASLGAGGMGEVYKARDTRLGRTVALKVLPEHLSAKPQLRKRFEREARAISSLNHPHICALYDVGRQDGIDYLVMEYLEGETLAQRLSKGALPLEQVLKYAIEIATALDQAHRQGVIHRDLKPANIMLTKVGAKVLDFGLAKLGSGSKTVPSTTKTLTEERVILGTLQYMAPEQLEGKETDGRSDIFSFGAVLYEMATGRKAFEGKSAPSVMAAILDHEPAPISTLQPLIPPGLDHVVKTCIAKDPEARWQGTADLAKELRWIAETCQHPSAHTPVGRNRASRAWIVATVIATLFAGVFAFVNFTHKTPDAAAARFSFAPPFKADAVDVAVSPDGTRIAFAGGGDLWLRSVDSFTAERVSGTHGASRPFWLPDGRSIGFFANGLKRVDFSNGRSEVQTITSAYGQNGGSWSPAGVILYTPEGTGSGLYRISDKGGTPIPATKLSSARGEIAHRYPQFLPDGRRFIYWVWSALEENTGVYAGSLDPKDKLPESPLVRTWREARYAEPGYLLFLQGSRLMAQRFDTARLRLTGEPQSLPELVGRHWGNTGRAMFSASPSGVLAYQEAVALPDTRIVWRDRAGKQLRSIEAPKGSSVYQYSLAPDENRIALTTDDENTLEDLWVVDLERATSLRLTATHGSSMSGVWSPDGRRVAFQSNRSGVYDLYGKDANGAGDEELLVKSSHAKIPTGWSPDGRFLVYNEIDPKTGTDIWALALEDDRKPFSFLKTEFDESAGRLSPLPDSQGRLWMVYSSNETGQGEIYLRPFLPGASGGPAGVRVRVSTGGGFSPQWRKDGRELFYVSFLDGKTVLMAVDVKLGVTPDIGTPQTLFDIPFNNNWAPFADGRRFLLIEPVSDLPAAKINVVLNWTAELKRLTPSLGEAGLGLR